MIVPKGGSIMEKRKILKWIGKAMEGDARYQVLQKQHEAWKFISEGKVHNVDVVYLCVYNKNNIIFKTYWKEGMEKDEKQEFSIVIKEEKKLLFSDNKSEKVWGFGFKDGTQDVGILLCYRIGGIIQIIWSKSSDDYLKVAYSCSEEVDEGIDCLFEVLNLSTGKTLEYKDGEIK